MTLPTSGIITLNDIQNEFGGSNPIGLSEYYRGGTYISSTDYAPNVPTSGAISLNNFYGAKKTTFNIVIRLFSDAFYVPPTSDGVLYVYVIAGGGGGGMHSDYHGANGMSGGAGGRASAIVSVAPGTTYPVEVGARGNRGRYGYGYKDNPWADGFGGGGGGQSSFVTVVAGGGSGGAGGTPQQVSGAGGGVYGSVGVPGGSNQNGFNGGGTGNNLNFGDIDSYINFLPFGNGGQGGGGSHDYDTGDPGPTEAINGPQYAFGYQGVVVIRGYW